MYPCDTCPELPFLLSSHVRWLSIRLDFLGGMLIFIVSMVHSRKKRVLTLHVQVAMLAVFSVSGINAAQIGLVLTYSSMSGYQYLLSVD